MEKYEDQGLTPTKHMFAGYQYMEAQPKYDSKARFKTIMNEWKQMREKNSEHTIHIELAHFNYHHTIHYIMKYLFNHTDSIGFNEQELYAIYNQLVFYKNKDDAENDDQEIGPSSSRLTPDDSLNLISQLIEKYLVNKYPNISRVQYHTLGHMITCYDPDIWESADESLIKTGLTSATYCALHAKDPNAPLWKSHAMKRLEVSDHSSNMTMLEGYSTIKNTEDFMKYYKINNTKFVWGVISTPTCRKPTKLTGMGDNISSTGFTYQNKKSELAKEEK